MSIYPKPSSEMVFDVINQANPSLPHPVTPALVKLGVPAAQTPPSGTSLNTKLAVSATAEGTYVGRESVEYERLDLFTMFRGMKVEVPLWNPVNPGSLYNQGHTLEQLLPHLNRKYGFSFTMDDLADVRFDYNQPSSGVSPMDEVVTRVVSAKATSLGWVGSFSLTWKNAPRTLESAIPINELDIRELPGGNDFSGAHKEIVNFLGYLTDWSDLVKATPWTGYPNSAPGQSNSQTLAFRTAFFNEINARYGTGFAIPASTHMSYKVLALPSAEMPEANARFYNRVLLMTLNDGNSEMVGTFYVHYNV